MEEVEEAGAPSAIALGGGLLAGQELDEEEAGESGVGGEEGGGGGEGGFDAGGECGTRVVSLRDGGEETAGTSVEGRGEAGFEVLVAGVEVAAGDARNGGEVREGGGAEALAADDGGDGDDEAGALVGVDVLGRQGDVAARESLRGFGGRIGRHQKVRPRVGY